MKTSIRNFRQGLFLTTETDAMPEGSLLRAQGVNALNYGRSKDGAELLYDLDAHSLTRFKNVVFSGVRTSLYRTSIEIKKNLSGNRLSFVAMPPTSGIVDSLFVVGGGVLFKVDAAGNVTNWGIEAPTTSLIASRSIAGNLDGTYKYITTFQNNITGHRSLAGAEAASVAPENERVRIINVPTSTDPQVDRREIWRTLVGGEIFFRLRVIEDNITTEFIDNTEDFDLEDIELPYSNIVPYSYFDDCAGPHNASIFWITRTEPGERGRLFYSAIGRPEAMEGFIDVTGDDDPLQKILFGNGILIVFSESRCFQILGTNPYTARELANIPGTNKPNTAAVTSGGALYEANDGIRLLQGLQAPLAGFEAIGRLFRNESIAGLDAFSGVVSVYARDEYIISDTNQTIAFNLLKGTWRDLGIGCNAFHYAADVDIIYATLNNQVVNLEKEGALTDAGEPINFSLEPKHTLLSIDHKALVQWVHIEGITQDKPFTVTLILDGVETVLGIFSTPDMASKTMSFAINKAGYVAGVRISGEVEAPLEIFAITLDYYVPGQG